MNFINKKRIIWTNVLVFLMLISIPLYFIFFQKTNPRFTKIALKTNGKTYMYCFGLNKEKKTQPLGFILTYKDGGHYYITTNDIKAFANMMGGNIEVYSSKQPSHDGYFTNNTKDTLFQKKQETIETKNIGEQIQKHNISLLNKEKNTKMSIKWHYNQKELEYIPKKNCENRSFWTSTSVSPGETSFYKRKLLVVSIQDLASFYNCNISYNKKDDVLFISK